MPHNVELNSERFLKANNVLEFILKGQFFQVSRVYTSTDRSPCTTEGHSLGLSHQGAGSQGTNTS